MLKRRPEKKTGDKEKKMWLLHPIYEVSEYVFDPLYVFWERKGTQRVMARILVFVFLAGVLGIELNRQGLLPAHISAVTPTSHYHAISMAFTLVLLMEVMSLVFILPCSFSKSVGKQLEILALILLRNSFKELQYFPEPIDLSRGIEPVYYILSDGVGALLIFVALGIYYRMQHDSAPIKEGKDIYRFVAVKKLISLVLLTVFVGSAVYDLWLSVSGGDSYDFFETFYTVLIFTDILVVLISHQYLPSFHAVFRNSGYALATLLMRLALTAPQYLDAAIGIIAAAFAVSLTFVFNVFAPSYTTKEKHFREERPVTGAHSEEAPAEKNSKKS